jgi:hypothetical protein
MQITNASRELSSEIGTDFSYFLNCLINEDRKVKFGHAPGSGAGWNFLFLIIAFSFFGWMFVKMPPNWSFPDLTLTAQVILVSIVLLIPYNVSQFFKKKTPPDNRKEYIVSKIGVVQRDRVSTKSTGKSLVGAGVGGVLFGGAGAVVGAVSAGNLVSEFIDIAVKFTDNNWIVLSAESKEEGLRILSLLGSHADQECPI